MSIKERLNNILSQRIMVMEGGYSFKSNRDEIDDCSYSS